MPIGDCILIIFVFVGVRTSLSKGWLMGNGIDEISADKKPTSGHSISFLRKR